MKFLHRKAIVHGDLCAASCYVKEMVSESRPLSSPIILIQSHLQKDGDVVAKVGDFGLATEVDSYLAKERQFRWSSPEVIERKSECLCDTRWRHLLTTITVYVEFTSACDVWSFGVTMWEVLTFGGTPFDAEHDADTVVELITRKQTLLVKPKVSECLALFCLSLLSSLSLELRRAAVPRDGRVLALGRK